MTAAVVGLAALAPARADPVSLTDMNGRMVRLAQPAERIVALPLPAASMLIAADRSARRLTGLHPTAARIMLDGPLGRLFPELRAAETSLLQSGAAFMPNVEAIAASMPDLVVQRGELGADIVKPLEEAGLATLLVSYGDEERTRANLSLIGAVVGQAERAAELVAWRDRVAADLAQLPASGTGVLFLSRSGGDFQTTGAGTPNDHAIRVAGGRNLAGDLPGSSRIGVEQLLAFDPDVIVLNSGDPKLDPESLAADPVLSALRAVATRRVYKAPTGGYRLEPPSPENPLYWLWLAAVLRPEGEPAATLRAAFAEGFGRVYGSEPTPAEIDAMLQVEANRTSAGYERLRAAP